MHARGRGGGGGEREVAAEMTGEALHEIAYPDCVHVTALEYVLFTIY